MLRRMSMDRTDARTLRMSRPATPQSVSEMRSAALDVAHHLGALRPYDVALAVSEAVTNTVIHAYADGARGPVLLTMDITDEGCRVVVSDEGSGLRPRPDSPGLGLGLPLMAELADSIEIKDGPARGVDVVMTFRLAG